MKPQEKKLVDSKAIVFDAQKIKDQVMIIRSLNETQAQSTIEHLTTTLKMVHEIDVLDQIGGLGLNDFFKEIKQAPAACVHFYRPATFRCNIIDKHMRRCAAKYVECKFVKINAEKCPYLCEKLHIWCLPSIVLIVDGKTHYTCVGLNDFGGDDDFSDEAFACSAKIESLVSLERSLGTVI